MSSTPDEASQRGLVLIAALLVVLLVVFDLLRPDSLLRELWGELFSRRSFLRGFLEDIRERGPGRVFQR